MKGYVKVNVKGVYVRNLKMIANEINMKSTGDRSRNLPDTYKFK